MAYQEFAEVYDLFNDDADYDALCGYVHAQLCAHGVTNGIVADLGCGTGELTLRLAQLGYDMIGVDLSVEMLSVLREKMYELSLPQVLLLNQDITQLDLYGTVQAVVSTFDTFNHLAPAQFAKALRRSAFFLEKDGVYVFDMNTPYKHAHVLADSVFELEADDASCVWSNTYEPQQNRTKISLEITYEDGANAHESFYEYVYSLEEIEAACEKAGLAIVCVCDGESFTQLSPTSQRYCVTAIKKIMPGEELADV